MSLRRAFLLSAMLHATALGLFLLRPEPALPPPPQPLTVSVELVETAPEEKETGPPAPEAAEAAPLPERLAAAPPPRIEAEPEPQPQQTEPSPAPEPEPAPGTPPPPPPAREKVEVKPEVPPPPAPREAKSKPAPPPPVRPRPSRVARADAAQIVPVPRPRRRPPPPVRVEAKADVHEPPAAERADRRVEDPLDALLRSVENLNTRVRAEKSRQGRGVAREGGREPVRSSEGSEAPSRATLAALQRMVEEQVYRCWIIPVGAQNARGLRVLVRFTVEPDGTVRGLEVVDRERLARDPVFRIVAESAIRAVRRCSPLQLPREYYAQWRAIEMNFDLERALSG